MVPIIIQSTTAEVMLFIMPSSKPARKKNRKDVFNTLSFFDVEAPRTAFVSEYKLRRGFISLNELCDE